LHLYNGNLSAPGGHASGLGAAGASVDPAACGWPRGRSMGGV